VNGAGSRAPAAAALAALAALATTCLLAGCSGAPPAPTPSPARPDDPAARPVPVEPAPQVPLPGEQGQSQSPLLARALLPNGLNFALLRHATDLTHTATFTLHFTCGTQHGKPGAADLAAWLFVRGADLTEDRPSLQRQIESLGGTLSIELGPQGTWFTVRIDEDRWRQALLAVAKSLVAPPPSRGMLERAQRELLQQHTDALATDTIVANAERMLLGDGGGGDHLAALRDRDPSEGVVFQSRNYRPDHSALVLEVPGDPKAIDAVVRSQFAGWEAAKVAADPEQGPHARALAPGVHWADGKRTETECRCGLVLVLPDQLANDAAAGHLLWNCLTMDGIGGRLERMQQEAGLGNVVWQPTWVPCAELSAMVLTARTTPANAAKLWTLAQNARRSLREFPPTPSERTLARARTWLSLRRPDADARTRLRALALRVVAQLGEDQMLERLTDLEQPDAVTGTTIDAFLQLPMAMIVVGGQPPTDLADVTRFDAADEALTQPTDDVGDQLIAAARPWLEQALQAIGGRDRVRRITGFAATSRLSTDGAPDVDESFTWTVSGTLHRTRTLLGATIVTDLQGKQWTETAGTDKVELTPVEANWRLAEIERHPLVLLGAHARGQLRFRLLATQRHDDRDFVLLEAVTDRFERLRLQIDRESGLVRIVEAWSTSPEGLPTRAVDTWSDYRTVDGVRVPFRRVTVVDDGQSRRVADFERVQPTTRAD